MSFDVEGHPSPGGSKNAFRNPRTGRIVVVDAGGKKTKVWRQAVAAAGALAMRGRPLLAAPIGVVFDFRMSRPKAHYHADGRIRRDAPPVPIVRPDATKLQRSTEDALTGIVWRDDAEIAEIRTTRAYAFEGSSGVRVTAFTIRFLRDEKQTPEDFPSSLRQANK